MTTKPKFIVFDKRQTLAQSIASDIATFLPLAFLIWISHGSRWWTFFAGALAIMWVLVRLSSATTRRHTFTDAAALLDWAEQQAGKDAP